MTTISGIMILFALLLSLQVDSSETTDARQESRPRRSLDRTREITALSNQVADLRKKISSSKSLPSSQLIDPLAIAREIDKYETKNQQISNDMTRVNQMTEKLQLSFVSLTNHSAIQSAENDELRQTTQQLQTAISNAPPPNQVRFISDKRTDKTPLLVECSEKSIRCGIPESNDPLRKFNANDFGQKQFRKYATSLSKATHYIVFQIKPSGVLYAMSLVKSLKEDGYDVGYDALEEKAWAVLN